VAGEPRTIDAPIPGPANTQVFTLPPGVTLNVEAVYIEVDTTGAGGPVTGELTIAEQSGVVIAKKPQSQTVDPGIAGTATWALRLGDDAAGGTPSGLTIREEICADMVTLPSDPGGPGVNVPWTLVQGVGVWDHTVPSIPKLLAGGLLFMSIRMEMGGGGPTVPGELLEYDLQIPAPIAVFPVPVNLIGAVEATAALPRYDRFAFDAGQVGVGMGAILNVRNDGALPIDLYYQLKAILIVY
jgi:hypothetical protein